MLEARIRQIIVKVLGIEENQITEEAFPEAIPTWDSLTHLTLIFALEEEFDIAFSSSEIHEDTNSFKKIVTTVSKRIIQ